MLKRIILCSLFVCAAVNSAEGVELHIRLNGLQGDYNPAFVPYSSAPGQKSVIFDALLYPPFTVTSASFRLVGTAMVEDQLLCGASQWYDGYFHFYADFPDSSTGGSWTGDFGSIGQSGPFDRTAQMTAESGATWEYFEETKLLYIVISGYGCCFGHDQFSPCSEAVVDESYLILDLEFEVSTDESTWGAIKALYNHEG